jgi:hypothetical protein
MNYSKRTLPFIPVGHPDYVWKSHADVQETWRRYGWQAPSGQPSLPVLREAAVPEWVPVRRVK